MAKHDNNQFSNDAIIEIKREIQSKIDKMGYQEYRLSQQEKLRKFIEQSGWKTVDGDKLLKKMEESNE